jgi:metal-sulfur cluster biosynthetic enzyme
MTDLTPDGVRQALLPILDPEIDISIVELGLIRGVDISPDGRRVRVVMTLTTPFCPEGPRIVEAVRRTVHALPGVEVASVDLVWSPPWDPETDVSDEVKAELGIWD